MIKSLRILTILTALFIATPSASAADIPFLTWENGKQQAIVLGGPSSSTEWKMALVGENTKPLVFKASTRNSQGFYVFSIDLPTDLTPGAYRIETTGTDGKVSVVAGVQVKEREIYTITEIPTDLRLLAILFAIITALYTVVRSRKYSRLVFARDSKSEGAHVLYRFRDSRLASFGDSFLRYLALRDGEPLHKLNKHLWSALPWLSFPLGVYTAIAIQFDAAIPNGPLYLLFICAIIGALDATSGISLAFGLGLTHVALGNVTSLRTLLIAATFSLAWYLPALIGSMVHLTVPRDFGSSSQEKRSSSGVVSSLAAGLFGGLAVVISVILTDSLVINRVADSLLRWPLAITVGAVIALKYIAEGALVKSRSESELKEERLYLARVVSPGMAMTLSVSLFAIIFIWTQSYISALVGAVVMATPYFLLFLVFPRLALARLESSKRSLIVEAILIGAFTFGIYALIQLLPTTVIAKSQAFILLGLVPGLLHGVYSVFVASSEHAAGKAKEEAMA
jgi:hypothetical protein